MTTADREAFEKWRASILKNPPSDDYEFTEEELHSAFTAGLSRGREEMEEICGRVGEIAQLCDHQIPFYAYGDNEAACQMAHTLAVIQDALTSLFPPKPEDSEVKR